VALEKKLTGTLYGVGVGPGDPELITLKAVRLIRSAKVIAYPKLTGGGPSLARSIAAEHISTDKIEISIETPMLPEKFPDPNVYDRCSDVISGHLENGQDVAVLCEGDPFFYGSFIYIFERLAPKYITKVIAGVSSLGACAGAAGIPLVSGNQRFEVIPAPIGESLLEKRLMAAESVAVIKIGRHLEKVKRILFRLDLLDKAIFIERATMKNQKIKRVSDPTLKKSAYFSMILICKYNQGFQ